jgi:hypothetical protein
MDGKKTLISAFFLISGNGPPTALIEKLKFPTLLPLIIDGTGLKEITISEIKSTRKSKVEISNFVFL